MEKNKPLWCPVRVKSSASPNHLASISCLHPSLPLHFCPPPSPNKKRPQKGPVVVTAVLLLWRRRNHLPGQRAAWHRPLVRAAPNGFHFPVAHREPEARERAPHFLPSSADMTRDNRSIDPHSQTPSAGGNNTPNADCVRACVNSE